MFFEGSFTLTVGQIMRREKQTSRDFYRHTETDEVFYIERRWDGVLIGSCPATEPLKALDTYK